MQVSIFCASGLKKPIHAPKSGVLGDLIPYMRSGNNGTPKRHIFARKHVIGL